MRVLGILVLLCSCMTLFAEDHLTPAVPAKVERYAALIMQRYDKDSNGMLLQAEWAQMRGNPQAIDIDGNQQITHAELVWYFAQFGRSRTIHHTVAINLADPYQFNPANLKLLKPVVQRPAAPGADAQPSGLPNQKSETELTEEQITSNDQPIDDDVYQKMLEDRQIPADRPYHVLPENLLGVPAWFVLKDNDGDGQISLTEFAPTLLPAMINLFKQFDKNGNGLIEPAEVRHP